MREVEEEKETWETEISEVSDPPVAPVDFYPYVEQGPGIRTRG